MSRTPFIPPTQYLSQSPAVAYTKSYVPRDSGYAPSSHHQPFYSPPAATFPDNEPTAIDHGSPATITSPILAQPQYGPDYARMDSPPSSTISLKSWLIRIQRFIKTVNALPWIAKGRVTVDYYPGIKVMHQPQTVQYQSSLQSGPFDIESPTPFTQQEISTYTDPHPYDNSQYYPSGYTSDPNYTHYTSPVHGMQD